MRGFASRRIFPSDGARVAYRQAREGQVEPPDSYAERPPYRGFLLCGGLRGEVDTTHAGYFYGSEVGVICPRLYEVSQSFEPSTARDRIAVR